MMKRFNLPMTSTKCMEKQHNVEHINHDDNFIFFVHLAIHIALKQFLCVRSSHRKNVRENNNEEWKERSQSITGNT